MSESATNKMEGLRTGGEQTPSELDWQVYRLIRVEQWPLSNVGQALGISEARVGQIVDHVGAHMVATAPILSKDERERQLGASKQLAAERIDFLYGEALRCFRSSQGLKRSSASRKAKAAARRRAKIGVTLGTCRLRRGSRSWRASCRRRSDRKV